MMRLNPWHFDDSYDHFLFYNALMRRQNYMERENLNDIRDIIYHALIHPEVYDVLWYMKSQGEIDEKMIRAANAPPDQLKAGIRMQELAIKRSSR